MHNSQAQLPSGGDSNGPGGQPGRSTADAGQQRGGPGPEDAGGQTGHCLHRGRRCQVSQEFFTLM